MPAGPELPADHPDRQALVEALAARARARLAGGGPAFEALDVLGTLREVSARERAGQFRGALELLHATLALAQTQADAYLGCFLRLRAALSCMKSCNEDGALALVALALFGEAERQSTLDEATSRAEALDLPGEQQRDLRSLRALALYAVGRLGLMIGALEPADRALGKALALLGSGRDPFLDAQEVALLRAQGRLDAGRLDAYDALSRGHAAGAAADRVKWRLLDGLAAQLRGHLSEAAEAFRAVMAPGTPVDLVQAAAWQLANVLGLLNRLSEARDLLATLPDDDRRAQLERLLEARSGVTTGPPAPAPSPPPHPTRLVLPEWHRTEELFRSQWIAQAQEVQLALHRGAVEEAAGRFALLRRWAQGCDSALIEAERLLLQARLALALDQSDEAGEQATRAAAAYGALGMPVRQREALLVVSASASTRGLNDQATAAAAEAEALLDRVHERLSPADRKLHELNKWGAVDDQLALELAAVEKGQGNAFALLGKIAGLRGWDQAGETAAVSVGLQASLPERIAVRAAPVEVGVPMTRLGPGALPRHAAVLYFVVLPDRLSVFVISGGTCRLVTRAVGRAGLWERARAFLLAAQPRQPPVPEPARREAFDRSGRELSAALGLDELLATLPARVRHLYVVPDEVLVHLPFPALPAGGAPLCKRFSVSIIPYPRWVSRRDRGLPRPRRALAVGIRRSRVAGFDRDGATLPSAEEEASMVEKRFAARATALLGASATHEAVQRALTAQELAHFACHGHYEPTAPDRSGLVLHDRCLTVADLDDGPPLTRLGLAVLSACSTARTFILPGREMVGVADVLIRRGARAALTALWPISDIGSRRFTEELYPLVTSAGVAQGLARLQRSWASRAMGTAPPPIPAAIQPVATDWAAYLLYEDGIVPSATGRLIVRVLLLLRRWRRRRSVQK